MTPRHDGAGRTSRSLEIRKRKNRRDDDWFDDDFYDGDDQMDGDAFSNTLRHLGTDQIDAIFRCRAELPANIDDAAFVPLLEVMVKPLKEFLSPEQWEQLWDYAYTINYEWRKEGEPGLKYNECKKQLQQCLREPHPVVPEPKKSGKAKKTKRGR